MKSKQARLAVFGSIERSPYRGSISYKPDTPKKPAKEHLENISHLLSVAIGSAKIRKLTLHQRKGPKQIRAQMHVILRAPTGAVKSTILSAVAKHEDRPVLDEITRPGLVGTVDQRVMQLIPGAAWEYRNGLLLFDEFRFRRQSDDWVVFLKLLEDQTYTRKLGVFSSTIKLEDGDLYLRQENGQIEMKTRFAVVLATMRDFRRVSSQEFKAFVNRCIPYEYDFTLDELADIAMGADVINIKEYDLDEEVEINRHTYFEIAEFVRKCMSICDTATVRQNYLRTVGDLCRIHAVEGYLSYKFARQVINWKIETYNQIGLYYREKETKRRHDDEVTRQ
jgi:hypothetical protein